MNDLISRQAAIDLIEAGRLTKLIDAETAVNGLKALPSAQPEQEREFIKLTVRDSNGRPYYSIIYLEVDKNGIGHDFEGYSSYDLDVISDYLKRYFGFGTSAQPERKNGKWIYHNDDLFPAESTMECDQCHAEQPLTCDDEFCPHCGVRMEEE